MTDKNIKRWTYEVRVKDSGHWLRQYDMLVAMFNDGLREQGYVPLLDLDPHVAVVYDEKEEAFDYVLTIQSVYVGRKVACNTVGIANGRLVAKSTPKPKSRPSSKDSD